MHLYRIQTRSYNEKGPLSYLMQMSRFFILSSIWCIRLYAAQRHDVFHFHNIPDFGVFCTMIPKWLGAKIILDIHDLVPEFYQRKFDLGESHVMIRILKMLEKQAARFADHVITVTTLWENTLTQRSVSPEKCTVILNAPDPSLFFPRTTTKARSGPTVLVYHGNLSEIFGVDLAIQAMPRIKNTIGSVVLDIYGQGKDVTDLKRLARSCEVEDVVRFHRPVPRQQIPEILRDAHLGIDPKRDGILAGEGLSSKCMEYLAMELPAVVSAIPAAKTYYRGNMVQFFNPGNSADLAEQVIHVIKNKSRIREMIKHSRVFNREHHWSVYESRYFELLNKMVGDHA